MDDDYGPCPICGFVMREVRGCTAWCRNCGWKGQCGEEDLRSMSDKADVPERVN